jgi:uncharacterized protein YxeA
MKTAIILIIIVFLFIIGSLINFWRDAKNTKVPKNYDRSKTGFDDEEDDW